MLLAWLPSCRRCSAVNSLAIPPSCAVAQLELSNSLPFSVNRLSSEVTTVRWRVPRSLKLSRYSVVPPLVLALGLLDSLLPTLDYGSALMVQYRGKRAGAHGYRGAHEDSQQETSYTVASRF